MWKNKLQEFCQKKGIALPVYDTQPVLEGGKIFFSSVIKVKEEGRTLCLTSPLCTSKKEAEMKVAYGMYTKLTSRTYYKKVCLIDLENVHYFNKPIAEDVLYLGFITSTHCTTPKYSAWKFTTNRNILKESSDTNLLMYTINGGDKNLVDHFVTAFVCRIAEYIKEIGDTVEVHILTSDNAGWCTRRCLESECEEAGVLSRLVVLNGREMKI